MGSSTSPEGREWRVKEVVKASSKEAAAAPAAAPMVPTEDPAAYDENRVWRDIPWGDTYWCEMCSTCMRWRHSQRARGRVCVTSFNFNFPLVVIEGGRCNEYRPVPGAEGLWTEEYVEEEDEYEMRRREGDPYDDDGARRGGGGSGGGGSRRRSRRRPRRGGSAPQGNGM
jgi:hypothetical protein